MPVDAARPKEDYKLADEDVFHKDKDLVEEDDTEDLTSELEKVINNQRNFDYS